MERDKDKICFVAVEFQDDPNVAGNYYWYLCDYRDVCEGQTVIAPLGRHNRLQKGTVRKTLFTDEYHAPYPLALIKKIVGME